MKWYTDLYLGKSITRRYRMLQYKITHKKIHPTAYLITLAQKDGRILEIIPSTCLLQRVWPDNNLFILGMAGSRKEAIDLAGEILIEVYREHGDFDLRSWLYPAVGGDSL